jgi:predicted dithiol-disulfide oxidoreductase (DUF899 family)
MTTATMEKTATKVVPHTEWVEARKQFLAKEREFTHLRDDLSRQRRELPWERVEKNYEFQGPSGKQTLADLFGDRNQLVVYHFMFGPGWKEGCPSCSFLADQFDSIAPHMAQRDTALVAISRATLPEIEAFKKRMGWKFTWVSSNGSDFNYDYQASAKKTDDGKVYYNYAVGEFPSEELPGASVFYRRDGEIFHSYSAYARGLDMMLNAYNFLDLTPKGRDEDGLPYPMAWIRHHDKYGNPNAMDAMMVIAKSEKGCCEDK